MDGHYHGRFNPKATKAQLWNYLEEEVAFAKQQDKLAQRNYENLIQRRNDLLEANNRYLERARNAEAGQRVAEREMMAALDRIDFMQGEYDAAVRQHLEQDTWARMEIEKQKARAAEFQREYLRTINRVRRLYDLWSILAMGSTVIAVLMFILWLIK